VIFGPLFARFSLEEDGQDNIRIFTDRLPPLGPSEFPAPLFSSIPDPCGTLADKAVCQDAAFALKLSPAGSLDEKKQLRAEIVDLPKVLIVS
jgi:hypothetical protein